MTNLKALEIWTAQTICDVGILLSIVSALLHAARPYFTRVLGTLTLRVAADLWWLGYVVARDVTLFVALLCGLWTLNLDLMADIKIALPFVPLGTVVLAAALAAKVLFGTDAPGGVRRFAGVAVALAASLNLFGWVFVMEGPGDEYAAAASPFWATLRGLRSNLNPELSTATFVIAGTLLLLVGTISAIRLVGVKAVAPEGSER